jgi:hypothetical protein
MIVMYPFNHLLANRNIASVISTCKIIILRNIFFNQMKLMLQVNYLHNRGFNKFRFNS